MARYAHWMMVYVSVGWGVYWMAARHASDLGFNPLAVVAVLNLLPCVGLLLFCGRSSKVFSTFVPFELLISAIYTMVGICFTLSLVYTEVVKASVLFFSAIYWSVIISWIFLKEHFSLMRLVGICVGFLGAIWVIELKLNDFSTVGWGDAAGLASGVLWSVALILMHRNAQANILRINIYVCFASIVASAVAAILVFEQSLAELIVTKLPSLSPYFWLYTVLMLFAFLFSTVCARLLKPVHMTMFVLLEIVVATVSAALIDQEWLTLQQVAGVAMIGLSCSWEIRLKQTYARKFLLD